jgi:predicted phosphodiesterase
LFPEETIRVLRERRIPTIRGNHDRWAISEGRDNSGSDLTDAAVAFLEGLPASWTRTIDEVRVAVWHARPCSDMNGIYPDASTTELGALLDGAECDVLVVGHTHPAFARFVGRWLVCNPGGLPRDPAQPMDGAMLFDRASGRFAPTPALSGGGPSAYWSCRRYGSPSAGRRTATRSRARDEARTRKGVRCLSGATSHAERTWGPRRLTRRPIQELAAAVGVAPDLDAPRGPFTAHQRPATGWLVFASVDTATTPAGT